MKDFRGDEGLIKFVCMHFVNGEGFKKNMEVLPYLENIIRAKIYN